MSKTEEQHQRDTEKARAIIDKLHRSWLARNDVSFLLVDGWHGQAIKNKVLAARTLEAFDTALTKAYEKIDTNTEAGALVANMIDRLFGQLQKHVKETIDEFKQTRPGTRSKINAIRNQTIAAQALSRGWPSSVIAAARFLAGDYETLDEAQNWADVTYYNLKYPARTPGDT